MISVIICTYNRANMLKTTFNSLLDLKHTGDLDWELIIVDNKSSDNTRETSEEFAKSSGLNVKYIFEEKQGLSFARNAGIQTASGDILAFTDDDVTVDPQWLTHIVATFADRQIIGMGGRVIPVWTTKRPTWYSDDGPYSLMSFIVRFDLGLTPCEMKSTPFGANMIFRRSAFEKYGLFRTDLGRIGKNLLHGEDSEFGRRLLDGGERMSYVPQAIVYHPVEPERATKKYAEDWYLMYGRTSARMSTHTKELPSYFGVPRYLFRKLIEVFVTWAFTFNADRRFYHKLQTYRFIGEISEYHLQRDAVKQRNPSEV